MIGEQQVADLERELGRRSAILAAAGRSAERFLSDPVSWRSELGAFMADIGAAAEVGRVWISFNLTRDGEDELYSCQTRSGGCSNRRGWGSPCSSAASGGGSSDGLAIVDPDRVLVDANPAFHAMHGYADGELQGRPAITWTHAGMPAVTRYLGHGGTERPTIAARHVRKDGGAFPVEIRGTTFAFRGSPHLLGVRRPAPSPTHAPNPSTDSCPTSSGTRCWPLPLDAQGRSLGALHVYYLPDRAPGDEETRFLSAGRRPGRRGGRGVQRAREAVDRPAVLEPAGDLPDVVLMDLRMPAVDGIEATRAVKRRFPGVEVVAVTSFLEESKVRAALEAGAAGYLLKDAEAEEVASAVRAAVRCEVHLDPAVARQLTASLRAPQVGAVTLTPRECEVLALVADGRSNRKIAKDLVVTERTARTHVSNILVKLGLASRTQAALWAVREGIAPGSG